MIEIGNKYGRLTVIKKSQTKNQRGYWLCKCECGKQTIVRSDRLPAGKTQSCGCYRQDRITQVHYKGGKYITGKEYSNIKYFADKRNIEFNLTIQQIENLYERQNKKCKLTGREISFNTTKRNSNRQGKIDCGNASIDRINSNKGYHIRNIQLVDKDVNFAKQQLTQKEFIQLCKEVVQYNG